MSEAEYDLNLPLEEEARSLKIRDVVYLTGEVYTIRDMACNRILNTLSSDETLPFDLNGKAIWHCSPITKPEGKRLEPVPGGSTTISRFTDPASQLVERLRIRLAVGKGSMGKEALTTLSKHGVAYIITTGGAAEYYACQIEEVKAVHWLDLGIPSAVWVFKVKEWDL